MCPLRFLVISVMRQLRNVQSFKTYVFRFWTFCHERDTGQADYPTLTRLHGKLSPRLTWLPYLADRVTRLSGSLHLLCKRDQDKVRNYMDRRVTSPTWGPPGDNLPCKRLKVGYRPSQGRFYEKKALKPSNYVLKLCTFPSRIMAEITRNRNEHTRSVKCSHFGIFSVVNRPYFVSQTIPKNVMSQRFLA